MPGDEWLFMCNLCGL